MISYKNGPVADWQAVDGGTVITFESNKPRHIKLEMVANGDAEVWVSQDEQGTDATLLGCVDRRCMYKFACTVDGTSYVQIKAKKDVRVEVKTQDLDQTIEVDEKPSFVNLEPRTARNPELVFMERMLKANQEALQATQAQVRNLTASMTTAQEPAPEAPSGAEAETEANETVEENG
jgi:hypothetical protein